MYGNPFDMAMEDARGAWDVKAFARVQPHQSFAIIDYQAGELFPIIYYESGE